VLRRLRQTAPVVLVPLAWSFVTAVHLGWASMHALVISHIVMSLILLAFAALSWSEMKSGVLLVWKLVLLAGLGITLLGLIGLVEGIETLLVITLIGWMLVPGAGLAYTGWAGASGPTVYFAGAVCSALGALAYVAGFFGFFEGMLVGLALIGIGQTAGIANAVYREA
jgi:hypothetical protein